jgi:hypothetical protein
MGDAAEKQFEIIFPSHHRFGINRPNMHVPSIPLMLRYAPDYMVQSGLVECMGVGRDATLKLKLDKLSALLRWELIADVSLFVWDSHRSRYWIALIQDWNRACVEHGEVDEFNDNGKPYVRLKSTNFPTSAVKFHAE